MSLDVHAPNHVQRLRGVATWSIGLLVVPGSWVLLYGPTIAKLSSGASVLIVTPTPTASAPAC